MGKKIFRTQVGENVFGCSTQRVKKVWQFALQGLGIPQISFQKKKTLDEKDTIWEKYTIWEYVICVAYMPQAKMYVTDF